MIYAGILAGGIGKRMGKTELPKQFLNVSEKPIIINTLEQFVINPNVDKVIVAVPENWINYTIDLIKEYKYNDKIEITCGGTDRNDTIMEICKYIEEKFGLNDDDIIITHDAVRPFVTQRIINENIEACREYGATDTVIPATDTIVESVDKELISSIPNREFMYQGQTPQSFKIKELMNVYNELSEDEKNILTDACKIYAIKNKNVKLVKGEIYNIKITTQYDLKLAKMMVKIRGEEDA